MLRPWVTFYYGYCLFQLGFPIIARFGYQVAAEPQEAQVPTWYVGNGIRFQRYTDPFCTRLPTSNTSDGFGWFGGEYTFRVPLKQPHCVKLPSNMFGQPQNTYLWFRWDTSLSGNTMTCTPGASMNFPNNIELWFHNEPNCQFSPMATRPLYLPYIDFPMLRDMNYCFRDTQAGGDSYYRAFCDVPEPTKTVTKNITTYVPTTHYVTNNITTYVPTTHYVTNNVTQILPSVVKPDDLIPLIMTLMARNASLFRILSNTPSPAPVAAAPNQQPQKSSASDTDGLVAFGILWGLLFAAVAFA
jgi:hypothetical protein